MIKRELAEEVARRVQTTRSFAEKTIDATFQAIKDALIKGKEVRIRSFGRFCSILVDAKKGFNPRKREHCVVNPHRRIKFIASEGLKKLVRYTD